MAKQHNNPFTKIVEVSTAHGPRKLNSIILSDNDEGVVFIPLNSIVRYDYDRLKAIYDKSELDLMTALRDETLDNGRNGLVVYKNIIQVVKKKTETSEPVRTQVVGTSDVQENSQPENTTQQKPARKKPGRPPKAEASE